MTKRNHSSAGFTLVELIAGVGVVLVITAFLFPAVTCLRAAMAKAEVQTAAEIVKLDLARLQQKGMLAEAADQEVFVLDPDWGGYKFIRNEEDDWYAFRFSQIGAGKIKFTNSGFPKIRFGSDGGPVNMARLYLGHADVPDYLIVIQVQPVTGQILVYPKE